MLHPVVRCPMCGEAVWTDRRRCEVCGVVLGFTVPGTGVHPAVAPARDSRSTTSPPSDHPETGDDTEVESTEHGPPVLALRSRRKLVDRVHAHLHKALAAGTPAAALLHGPPGSGKSALLSAGAGALASSTSAARLDVRLPPGAREPLAPIERLVERWAGEGLTDRHDATSLPRRLSRRLRELAPGLSAAETIELESRLGVLGGVRGASAPGGEEVLRRPSPYLDALAKALQLDVAQHPLLVTLDGLDRASDEGRFLLAGLVRRLADLPVAWLATAREVDAGTIFSSAIPTEVLEVEPLGEEDMAALLQSTLGATPSRDLLALVHRLSQGQPGRALDVLRSLEQSKAVRRADGIAHVEPTAVGERLGAKTAEALAGVYWESLSAPDRHALQAAAVLGDVVWDEAVVALERARRSAATPESDFESRHAEDVTLVRGRLANLCRMGFLVRQEESEFPGTEEYVFALEGLGAFVTGTLSAEARARLHQAAARWLAVRAADKPGFLEAIAAHFADGGAPALAAQRYGEAADEARARTLYDRAVVLYRRKLDLLDAEDHPLRVATLHELGTVHVAMGRYDAAEESFRQMLRHAWALGTPGKVAVALSKLGRVSRARGDYAAALRDLEEALRLFRLCGDQVGVAAALTDLGSLRYLLGEYDEARRCHREALALRRELEDDRGTALALLHLAMLDRAAGLLDRATTKTQEALRLGEGSAAKEELAQAMNVLGVLAFDRGDLPSALGYLQEGLQLAAGADRRMELYLLNNVGEIQFWMGSLDDAARNLGRAMEMATEQEDRRALGEIQRNVARLSIWQQRNDRATVYADHALALAEQIGNQEAKGLAWILMGEVRASAGTPPGADPPDVCFRRGIEIFRRIGHQVELAKALHSWGHTLRARGLAADARAPLAEALQLFTLQGSAMADRVKGLLG
ncbi:MAG: tetratricopeptide repeat protein [Deltaproteobacteria bacterium]|nr:tetratricopeptide repeat protein [Deltaproteobacteria bacterium]